MQFLFFFLQKDIIPIFYAHIQNIDIQGIQDRIYRIYKTYRAKIFFYSVKQVTSTPLKLILAADPLLTIFWQHPFRCLAIYQTITTSEVLIFLSDEVQH